ncbi:hypothetical protein [Clostridium sp.]|uniref:hypothetical protein n=1 Tax=Clostridium sp. TaxID=1506 RepID=UPI00338FE060
MDQIVERKDQKRVLGQILKLHSQEHGWEKWNDEAENHTEAASASKAEKRFCGGRQVKEPESNRSPVSCARRP